MPGSQSLRDIGSSVSGSCPSETWPPWARGQASVLLLGTESARRSSLATRLVRAMLRYSYCGALLGGGSPDLPSIASVMELRCLLLAETPAFYPQSADLELSQSYVLTGRVADQILKTWATCADELGGGS